MTLDRSISIYERRRWLLRAHRCHNSEQRTILCGVLALVSGLLIVLETQFDDSSSSPRSLLHTLLPAERDLIADDDVIMTNICFEHYSLVKLWILGCMRASVKGRLSVTAKEC